MWKNIWSAACRRRRPSRRVTVTDVPFLMLTRLRTYASFVRFSHSVFALPFALVGALLAARVVPLRRGRASCWIVACMVTARSAAMGFNRLVDARFDARNPRTAMRELPRGRMSRAEATVFVVVSSRAVRRSARRRSARCASRSRRSRSRSCSGIRWPSACTSYTQLFLGLAMAVAPVGGWLAAGGRGGWEPWLLGLAIGTWVGGFDVLYACQDLEFDRREGLRSIPVRFGIARVARDLARAARRDGRCAGGARRASRRSARSTSPASPASPRCSSWEQSLVRADDLSQVKRAFDLNGWVGILYLADDRRRDLLAMSR